MKCHFLPYLLNSTLQTELASIRVVLQTRNTFHLQSLPVIGSVWPPETMCSTFFSAVTWAIAAAMRGIDVADHEVDAVALDQLARLLHAGADVVGGVLDQQFDLASENAALGVDLRDGVFGAHHLVAGRRGINAGQGIDHADPDWSFPARLNDER